MLKTLVADVCRCNPGIKHILSRSAWLFCFLLFHTTPLLSQKLNIDSLKQLLPRQEGVQKIRSLNALATAGNVIPLNEAIQYASEALRLALDIRDKKSIVTTQYELGILQAYNKEDSLGLQNITQGLEQSSGDAFLESTGYLKLGIYHLVINQPRKAMEYLNRSLEISNAKDLTRLKADAHHRLGAAYAALDIHENALNENLTALRLYEELSTRWEIARSSNSIATLYQRTGDYDHALKYLNRALKINESYNDAQAIMVNMINIGVVYQKKQDYDNALDFFERVLPLTKSLNDPLRTAIVTGNIGSTRIEQGKLQEGLEYLYKALAIKETLNNPKSTVHTLDDIASVKVKLRDAKGAKEMSEKVIRMAQQYGSSDFLRSGYLNLSKSYKLQGDYQNAYAYLEKYKVVSDSLFGIEKAQQISELQIQYDTEKKDTAINSLRQEKEIANAQKKIYILIGVLVLLVLTALYISQRSKAKRNRVLLEKEREIDRMKSNFFANISHEFRTPLSLILGPIETLLGRIEEPNHRFQLGLMKKSASRLLRLINQILELSKVQAGHLELKATKLNAVPLIKSVGAAFHSLAEEKGIRIEFESKEEEILVYCNQEQIETVCINLVSNAFKFSDVGGKITVRMGVIAPANSKHPEGEMELRVIDKGVGISPEHINRVFDRFYHAGTSSKEYGGTGIGLALTKELVELHGGTIEVASEVGSGTTVTVRIPLGKAHLREDQVAQEEIQPLVKNNFYADVPAESTEVHEERVIVEEQDDEKPIILVIEDNEDVRSYFRSILHPKYTLVEATNGEEGIAQAKAVIPDLIISDVMMPKMNGYEACRHLKQDEKTAHIPVILLTAKASLSSRIEGLETEADLYLSKPFVPRELLLCIENLIRSRKKLQERYNRQVILKPADIAINSTDELFLQRLMNVLEANYEDENFSVEQLSTEVGMSRSQLHRKLHALTNESTSQFIRSFRLQRAMALLQKNHATISEIAYKVGFSSHSYFNKCFQQHYGCTPSSVLETHPSSEHAKPQKS